jgi:hypothetical protein
MSLIKIYNPKEKFEILIESSTDWVLINPRTYDEKPYFEIKLLHGFNFFSHAKKCKDCKGFMDSLGKNTLDWYLDYNSNTYRLDLSKLGNETKLNYINSEYEYGTILILAIHEIPVDKESLVLLRENLVSEEKYEEACVIRNLINEI